MSFTRWLSNRLGLSLRAASPRKTAVTRRTFRPTLEALEHRWLPSTLTVLNTLDSGAGSLRAEIKAAHNGDTINFALPPPPPGQTTQTITLTSGELLITKNLTINGPGAGQLTISGNNASRVFELSSKSTPQVTISGLTISNGNGGGILNNSGDTLTVSNCILSGNTGAGIYNDGTLTVTGSTLSGNSSNNNGGGIYNDGPTLTVTNCTLSNNKAGNVGGGIYTTGYFVAGAFKGGIATISSSTLTGNFGGWGGGIAVDFAGTAELDNCKLNSNTSKAHGGAVWIGSGTLTLSSCTVSNNSSKTGGGIYVSGGTVTVTNTSSITENTAEYGGGIFISTNGTVTVENSSSITGSLAPSGYVADDVYNLGALDVDSSSWNLIGTVDGNQATPI
jgi:predicted outer membrane repeat protein